MHPDEYFEAGFPNVNPSHNTGKSIEMIDIAISQIS
jgi:hypothetical protein